MTCRSGGTTPRPASWQRARVVALATVVSAAIAGAATAQSPSPPTVPPDFEMPQAESSPGKVTFSHSRHVATSAKCSTCHMRDFKLKRGASGPVTLAAKQDGKFCGACHDGKTLTGAGTSVFAIDECDRCHR